MNRDESIFLLGADGKLERVPLEAYSSELILQKLIEDYPQLLAGEEIDPDDPPRWLLVKREAGIPDGDAAGDRWSVDHLLLDHNARPTIVEVKRSSDTRIRREVIGQMLDYAANAVRYWPLDRLQALAAETCGGAQELDRAIRSLIDAGSGDNSISEVEAYWVRVGNNLRNGELRLLFVADELPPELRRVIEFLNEHMPRIEVLGIEVRQFVGRNLRALVPRVVGQTERARQDKRLPPTQKIGTAEFLESCPEWSRPFFVTLFDQAASEGFRVVMGTKGFSIRVPRPSGQLVSILWGFPPGSYGRKAPALDVYLKYLAPFEEPDRVSTELAMCAAFNRSGYTTTLLLDPAHLAGAERAIVFLWQLGKSIRTA